MFKDKNYEQFVNQCVQKGREERRAGQGISLAQARQQTKRMIEQKSQQLNQPQAQVIYG